MNYTEMSFICPLCVIVFFQVNHSITDIKQQYILGQYALKKVEETADDGVNNFT
jgi:hypothetical protein